MLRSGQIRRISVAIARSRATCPRSRDPLTCRNLQLIEVPPAITLDVEYLSVTSVGCGGQDEVEHEAKIKDEILNIPAKKKPLLQSCFKVKSFSGGTRGVNRQKRATLIFLWMRTLPSALNF